LDILTPQRRIAAQSGQAGCRGPVRGVFARVAILRHVADGAKRANSAVGLVMVQSCAFVDEAMSLRQQPTSRSSSAMFPAAQFRVRIFFRRFSKSQFSCTWRSARKCLTQLNHGEPVKWPISWLFSACKAAMHCLQRTVSVIKEVCVSMDMG